MIRVLLVSVATAIAVPVAADAQSDRYARQLGNICSFDMTKPESVKEMQHQPGYFWLVIQALKMPGNDMPIRYLMAAKPAIKCDRSGIVVNEAMADKLIAAAMAEEAKMAQQSANGKS